MKIAIFLIFFLVAGCKQDPAIALYEWKQKIVKESENKVASIIKQINDDCDSSLARSARDMADSLIRLRIERSSKK